VRWLKLAARFGDDLPPGPDGRPTIPLLFDTVNFPPYAMLVCTVPCGSCGRPIALTTYQLQKLEACVRPRTQWPSPKAAHNPPRSPPPAVRWRASSWMPSPNSI
jgi:hypothetical protein